MNPRSPLVIGSIVVVLLVGLGLVLLARTGSGEPPAAAPAAEPTAVPSPTEGTPTAAPEPSAVAEDDGTSVLKVRVADCDGCQVTVRSAQKEGARDYAATVAAGMAQVEVPTPETLGLAFFLQGEKDGDDTPGRTLVTLQPDGIAAGEPVSAAQVDKATTGAYCWAGTTLDVAVVQLQAEAKGGRVQQAWADPALPVLADTVRLDKGREKEAAVACGTAQ
ncbi:MAG: hypothetical protein U0R64_10275 [Candidatus Nanopelagicales bacterium]